MCSKTLPQHLAVTVALVLALCSLVLLHAAGRAEAVPSAGAFVPGEIIVKLTPNAAIGDINGSYHTQVKERFLDRADTDIYLLKTTDGSSTEVKLDEIKNDPQIEYAEPNFIAAAPEAAARHRGFPADDAKPTDKNYSEFPYPDSALYLSHAHDFSKGKGTIVAVLDTGAQLGHPALKKNFEGVARYDFVDHDKDPSEPHFARNKADRKKQMVGHGTHVAGIVDLVAPRAKIMPLRVLNRNGYGTVFHIAEAVSFADSNGADVINLSLGMADPTVVGLDPPKLLRQEIEKAISDGVAVAAAAGNSNSRDMTYPAAQGPIANDHDGLLAVTSVDDAEKKSDFANYGSWVDISAPGEGILSTYPVNRYAYWSGTSMATPFISGEAALIIHQADGELDPGGVEQKIRRYARIFEFYKKNLDYYCQLGAGHADIGASVEQPEPTPEEQLCPLP